MSKSTRLPHPIKTKDGITITTIPEATAYMVALPSDGKALWNSWQHAAKLIMENADPEAIAKQLEYALLPDGQLDIRNTGRSSD